MAHEFLLTSDHVNYMVFRYLQEAGFTHTAFTFAHESAVTKAPVDPNNVAPGTLIALIQKGMQYLELEANLDVQEGEVDGDFKMLTPDELLTNDIDQLRQLVQDRREDEKPGPRGGRREKPAREKEQREKERLKPPPAQDRAAERAAAAAERAAGAAAAAAQAQAQQPAPAPPAPAPAPAPAADKAGAAAGAGPTPMEEDPAPASLEVPASSVVTLHGHSSEVYICSWNPTEPLLASGSGDATARIWNLAPGPNYTKSVALLHEVKPDKQKDVTTLDWNSDGSLLATGSYDGLARIWGKDGKLRQTLDKHSGPIFALKWNRKGDLLLSGSVDKRAIVWDAKAGEPKQIFAFHSAPTLDVDWRNNTSFATCSTDMQIHVCRVGDSAPLKTFTGHKDEVNAIKWDPSGTWLASCSDDRTAKVWSVKSDACVHDLTEHEREIYTIRWSPTGAGSANPNLPLLLATASFDTTVKLWDVDSGRAVHTLRGHQESVYSVAFSPNGQYVATGSFDKTLCVWSVSDGRLVRTCHGEAGIYEVCWNQAGDKVAACFANKTVSVVDMRL
mmetsp:Transcript_2383/g.6000  ORF Transcript_2383/g.6000 Transcript_2383/m.6000 type:complete len:559 (-) Transcript_2383:853-2529(-)